MTFRRKSAALILSLLMSAASHALTLDDTQILTVPVGSEGLTRVSVKGDKIAHIFCSPGNVGENVSHHESGHVFVSPDGLPSGTFLTVMTAGGTVQDLKLTITKGKGAPIVLEAAPSSVKSQSSQIPALQEKAAKILEIFVAGGIAPGFEEEMFDVSSNISRETRQLLHMKFETSRLFTDGQWRVHVFEGKNISAKEQVLRPEALTRSQDIAISINDSKTKPQGTTSFFVIQRKKKA